MMTEQKENAWLIKIKRLKSITGSGKSRHRTTVKNES